MKRISQTLLGLAVCIPPAYAGSHGGATFEPPKDRSGFDKIELGYSVDLTFTYQGLSHEFTPSDVNTTAQAIQPGLILPTADLEINAKVLKGFNVKLETMLSSHHHNETYVKGGYASIDSLDFVAPGFASGFMEQATLKIGVDDINFGDAHFRRTDNAGVFENPFVMNLAVESYMQAGFVELMYRWPQLHAFGIAGITNGQVNPDDVKERDGSDAYSYYAKLGYDAPLSDALRLRVTESLFYVRDTSKNSLYLGDKAGNVAREIFNNTTTTAGNDFGAGWKAISGYRDLTVSMTNLFASYLDTEFFGLLEIADGTDSGDGSMELLHYAVDAVQRFGADNRFYAAARYENAKTALDSDPSDDSLTQFQLALGWFLSETAMAKFEYIEQERKHFEEYVDGKGTFDGFMISAALHF
jgi:hypothetical protein